MLYPHARDPSETCYGSRVQSEAAHGGTGHPCGGTSQMSLASLWSFDQRRLRCHLLAHSIRPGGGDVLERQLSHAPDGLNRLDLVAWRAKHRVPPPARDGQ